MSETPEQGSSSIARRALLAGAVLTASALMHWLVLAWLDDRLDLSGAAQSRSAETVEVALIARSVPPPDVPVVKVAPRPRPIARAAPKPVARPDAITAPDASAAPAVTPGDGGTTADDAGIDPDRSPGDGGDMAGGPAAASPAGDSGAVAEKVAGSVEETAPTEAVDEGDALRYGVPLPLPPTGHWRFRVHYGDYTDGHQVASLDYSIAHDGRQYRLRSEGRAEGLTALLYSGVLSQSSTGRLTDNGLEPQRYAEQRGKRAERWAAVDRSAAQVSFSGNPPVPWVAGAQDRLSVLVQIGLLARVAPNRFVAGALVEVPELTLRDIENARYASHGQEILETPDGPVHALHLERIAPRRPEDPRIDVWLGYDRGMLPVRIRLTDSGGRVLDQLSLP